MCKMCKEYVRMCKSVLGRGVRRFRVWKSGFGFDGFELSGFVV